MGGHPVNICMKRHNGMMVWDHLKDFHPNDTFILTYKYRPIGVRIKKRARWSDVQRW